MPNPRRGAGSTFGSAPLGSASVEAARDGRDPRGADALVAFPVLAAFGVFDAALALGPFGAAVGFGVFAASPAFGLDVRFVVADGVAGELLDFLARVLRGSGRASPSP
jgi:hypothetical protein